MANEPQRDIEQDLQAYKQRRREQAGAPLELHPSTRKMLQGEVARTASRPLLTSEEAAKNFVRSFVMSHQQPGFFARYRQRIVWGGAMFACLALVLAVLRNDPQRKAQEGTFPDPLPTTTPLSDPEARPSAPTAVNHLKPTGAIKAPVEAERLARDNREAQTDKSLVDLARRSAAPASGPMVNNPRPLAAASPAAPVAAVQREADRRSGVVAPAMPTSSTAVGNARVAGEPAPAPTTSRDFFKTDSNLARARAMDFDEKQAEKAAAGERGLVTKALKDSLVAEAKAETEVKKAKESKLMVAMDAKQRAPLTATTTGVGGALAPAESPTTAAPTPPTPPPVALKENLSFGSGVAGGAGEAILRQQFQQVDSRALYRQNFNSPPVPDVMKDFAFERTGDRVRIVDADGSTYEGTVVREQAEEESRKKVANLDTLKQADSSLGLKTQSASQAGQASQPVADQQQAYRFTAQGLNRKLKQSVEFRGEWQPTAPQPAQATPALLPTSYGLNRAESQVAAEKKEKATNALSDSPASPKGYLLQQSQKELSQGRISGRAVVGGKEEFDIKAVTK